MKQARPHPLGYRKQSRKTRQRAVRRGWLRTPLSRCCRHPGRGESQESRTYTHRLEHSTRTQAAHLKKLKRIKLHFPEAKDDG